jgi:RNA polymerase sigma factor (sigma-70 family)
MELTPEHMNIPAAAAREAWRICAPTCRALGLEIDELEGVAALALWRAVLAYDPTRSHDGEDGFSVYLVQRARWGIQTEITRRNSVSRRPAGVGLVSLDNALDESGELTGAALVSWEDHSRQDFEEAEQAGEVLRWLSPADREAVQLCYLEGLTMKEAGRRLGVWQEAVRKRLVQARLRARSLNRFRHLVEEAA